LDNRDSALKGGDNGIDIVPGDSAKSPLVFYVARLVEDLEMPPPGKGDPLTRKEVGLLRAWIDQGAPWAVTNPPVQFAFSADPTVRWIGVSGNTNKFREIEGMKEGFSRGLEYFSLQEQIGPDTKFSAEGHAIFPDDDILIKLALTKTDLGFVRGGFEQWRKYYDDTGGYYRPFPVPAFDLNQDLHLDIGRAWVDFGLTLPHWPQMVVGYEYQFRDGSQSTLQWGNVNGKNIYPAAEDINEHTHIVKFDLNHEFYGWRLEDSARVEFYENNTRRDNLGIYTIGPAPDTLVRTSEGLTHVEGVNTVSLERQLKDWWLLSGGYFYSKFDGDASFDQTTVNSLGVPVSGTFWSSDDVVLKRESHILSLGNLFLPMDWLSASAGVQTEWTHQEGAGQVHLDQGDPNLPEFFTLYPATISSDQDKQKISENVSVRMTKIPYTVLFAEARLDQESIGQFQQDQPLPGGAVDPELTFLRDTDFTNDRREYRAGFDTSPWRWVSLGAHYKRRTSDSDYDNDKFPADSGYPGFLRARSIDTDEVQTKLVLRPFCWLKTTLTYQIISTDYSTTTEAVPGGTGPEGIQAGKYDAHVYGLNTILTPFQRLYFSGTFTYSDSRTHTAQNGDPSIVPYKGDGYSVLASANYALSTSATLHATYAFSSSDYSQHNFAEGLPVGLNYTRHALMAGISKRINSNITTSLRYGFYQYSEPSTGGINNYTAHGVFATLAMKWP
jgi:hypothetical protein